MFDDFLYRARQELDFKKEKDFADFLGMSPAAFSARKKRGVSMEMELRAALSRHPEMVVDVDYILTGRKTISKKTTNVDVGADSTLLPLEQELLMYFRGVSSERKEMLLAMAKLSFEQEKKASDIENRQVS